MLLGPQSLGRAISCKVVWEFSLIDITPYFLEKAAIKVWKILQMKLVYIGCTSSGSRPAREGF
jgi:hypothetical protein